jgi:hypothetical protein
MELKSSKGKKYKSKKKTTKEKQCCDAITLEKTHTFTYKGGKERKGDFYLMGRERGGEGETIVRVFQLEGESQSGNPRAWKLFKVEEINELKSTNEKSDRNAPPSDQPYKDREEDDPQIEENYCWYVKGS